MHYVNIAREITNIYYHEFYCLVRVTAIMYYVVYSSRLSSLCSSIFIFNTETLLMLVVHI